MAKKKTKKPTNDEIEEEVLTSDSYHSQMQEVDEIEYDDDLIDYIKNNAKQAHDASVEQAKQDAKDGNQPFDYDYSEKGVPILPTPCEITKDSKGREIPHPVSPFDLFNPDKDIAIVYFTIDNKPLYENDKKTLKIAKSTDKEYMSLNDENAPPEVKAFASAIQRVVTKWEQKHPLVANTNVVSPVASPLTNNQKALAIMIRYCKMPENDFASSLSKTEKSVWEKLVKDPQAKKLIIENNVHPINDLKKLTNLVHVIKEGIKQDCFEIESLKTQSKANIR